MHSLKTLTLRITQILTALLLVVTLTVVQPPTSAAQTCAETTGAVTRSNFRSIPAETTFYYSVYTPPCYEGSTGIYPVVYLMHGSNEDDGQWLRLGIQQTLDEGIAAGTLPPMIVVMPYGEWLANENQFDTVSWENVFLKELMPLVESQYRIDQRRESRAIGGISRGGFWAYEIAFRNPDLFSAVGGHSAFFAEGNAPPDYDPLKLASSAANLDTLRIMLDRGSTDYAAPGIDLMNERLTERGISHTFVVYPEGEHNNTHWKKHVGEYLAFYAQLWLTGTPPPTPAPAAIAFATNTPQTPPTASPALAETTPEPTTVNEQGYALFVPAVSFPSLLSQISLEQLQSVSLGQPDSTLILDESTAAALASFGVTLSPTIPVVPDEALQNSLWRNATLYTLIGFDRLITRYRVLRIGDLNPIDTDLSIYPFAFPSDQPNFEPQKLTRLLMSGTTALTRLTRTALDEKGTDWAASGILPYVQRADFFHTSNEVSFSPNCPEPDTTPPLGEFCSKESHFNLFTTLGLDVVELTGNHNNDFGTENYLRTLEWYQQQGIQTIGGGTNLEEARKPVILNHNGNNIALLACNWSGPYYVLASDTVPGSPTCDWTWMRTIIPQLKAEGNFVVVSVQYQEVEDYKPSDQQVSDFKGVADLGADVVLGSQAHKPQTMSFYTTRTGQESFLHYGLGNLFFDQPFWGNSRFFMDELYIYDGKLLNVDLFTGIIDDLARPRPMTLDERTNFFAFMFHNQGAF